MTSLRKFFTICSTAAALTLGASIVRADITGSVTLEGKAPEMPEINMKGVPECAKKHKDPVYEQTVVVGDKGELANVVVALKPDDPSALGGEIPSAPAIIDQKGCMYEPHVLAMMVGQKMMIRNDDEFQHNVHSQAEKNPSFNFSQPNKDDGKPVDPPKVAEIYKVKCDVHPWMNAWVCVFEHPFFAVTGEDGKFDIKGTVPDGEYTITAWQEKYATTPIEQKVTVKDGKATVDFKIKAEGARGPEAPDQPKLASANTDGGERTMSCCSPEKSDAKSDDKVASASK